MRFFMARPLSLRPLPAGSENDSERLLGDKRAHDAEQKHASFDRSRESVTTVQDTGNLREERMKEWQDDQHTHESDTGHEPPPSPEADRRQLHFVQSPIGARLGGRAG